MVFSLISVNVNVAVYVVVIVDVWLSVVFCWLSKTGSYFVKCYW